MTQARDHCLAPVGEVLLAVIGGDPSSQRSADPDWRPTLPARQPGRFTLTDLLRSQTVVPPVRLAVDTLVPHANKAMGSLDAAARKVSLEPPLLELWPLA
jgi:hypothetical protein